MKKLLIFTFILCVTFSFAQQNDRSSLDIQKNPPTTLTSITASPNPFTYKTRINFVSNKVQIIEFSIKNLIGKTVYLEQVNTKNGLNTIHFDRNDLLKGMYIYSLQSETEIVSKRLVIK